MKDKLNAMLLKGEEILWTGQPEPFRLMELPSRSRILASWIISGGALAVLLGLLIPFYIRTQRSLADTVVLVVILTFLPLMISLRPILDRYSLVTGTLYAITNFRVIALIKDDIMYIPLQKGLNSDLQLRSDSCGDLYLGDAVGTAPNRLLYTAVMGVRTEGTANPKVRGMILFHIRDIESILRFFS